MEAQSADVSEKDNTTHENEDNEQEDSAVLPNIKEYQAQDDVSCITANNPEVNQIQ